MTLRELTENFFTPARRKAAMALLKHRQSTACGLAGSSAAVMLGHLPLPKGTPPVLVVGNDPDDAGYLYYDLCRVCGESAVAFFPSGYKRDIIYGQPDAANAILRNETLGRISSDSGLRFIVSSPEGLAELVASAGDIASHTFTLAAGESHDMVELQKRLRADGFRQEDYVFEPGQFAVRGSIIDIFGYAAELPVRLDFFGDEIDSIRYFNVETQLSEERVPKAVITSAIDTSATAGGMSLLEFINPATLIVTRGTMALGARIKEITSRTLSVNALTAEEGDAHAMDHTVNADAFTARLADFRTLTISSAAEISEADVRTVMPFDCTPQGIYHKNFDLISDAFKRLMQDGYTLFILSDNPAQFERLRVIFQDRGDDISFTAVDGTLHEGFVDHFLKRAVFTDHQIFDRFHKYTLKSDRARSGKLALSLKELTQIEPGDYIVHADHGVGKFAGLMRTDVGGRTQEMIKLVYQNNDIIMVSIHALHKLSKYRGKEGVPPKINRIGSGQWQKVKERTKSKLKDIARELITLYAARKEEKGYAFSPDSYLQQELEASFIYEDTPDQLTATRAVKQDMESDRPMDRLICGDVGFGKTEIAIRAAFKAATDSKQVAVLVPTTVLAYQHYNTFKQRLADLPVRVEYLSRARTPKETKAILADLAEGKIDIIIGTHKLIGKTVKFHDLGLLIIDEEQKFGVAVKEKLKQLKVNIDTLTMSATPIPRTLQFSLMGARDLSAINTPPANRYPIVTTVTALDDHQITEAINFELARNGQVFIINNRIEGLAELQAMIKRLVPDARTVMAHGQMPPEKLEKAIMDFTAHDYDILLATTIVESGIDMPNVNTIIVNNAQNFGLSELHQLRGRVGRSARKAFCYLMVPPGKPLSPVAQRRLQAIESFSELGSGIHIAMQDLDIRGAGNLLGAEQSGFIADLGYETYQRILKEAVTEIRTEEFPELAAAQTEDDADRFVTDCVIESDLELLLPATYVPQSAERMALYRELDTITRELDLQAFRTRLEDRFGRIPPETAELLRVPRLRHLARTLGIEKVVIKQDVMYTFFVDDSNRAYYNSPMFGRMLSYLQQHSSQVKIREKNGRRSFAFTGVSTIETAVHLLQTILSLKPV